MSNRLPSSKLGTKAHWDSVYERELHTFQEIGEEGEIWFGEETVEKMVDWALDNIPPPASGDISVLEVGSGNGTLLFALAEAGYPAHKMTGIDYSADAVSLAKGISETREGGKDITFRQCDFLRDSLDPQGWELILDKGTFDAIALMESQDKPAPEEVYVSRLSSVLKTGGLFLITSCNFTEDELKARFTKPGLNLAFHSKIKYPTFSFGGHSGTTYASVAFIKQ